MSRTRFIVSKSKLLGQYNILKDMGLDISFSLKTFPEIAPFLEEKTDCFFTIHMPKSLGCTNNAKRVWLVAQAITADSLDMLVKRGVENFIIDNEADLRVLLDYLEKNQVKINLLLRMKLKEHTIYSGKYFVFGMPSAKINELVPKLRTNPRIAKLGIHFHRKTQNTSEWNLKEELSQVLTSETLNSIDIVDIGGGLPVEYKNTSDRNIQFIFQKIVELRDWLKEKGIATIIEPGRFLAAPPTKLESEILTIDGNNIIVDASVYAGASDTILVPIKLLVEGELSDDSKEGEKYTIKGCTPCSMDILRYDVRLRAPRVGDKIVFLNAGAYSFSTDFCGLEKPEVLWVE